MTHEQIQALMDKFETAVMERICISKSTLIGLRTDEGYRNSTLSGHDYHGDWEFFLAGYSCSLVNRAADKALIAESVVLFETLRQRIAELEREKEAMTAAALAMREDMREACTLTVKLPEAATEGGQGYRKKAIWVLQEACFDAGITLVVRE